MNHEYHYCNKYINRILLNFQFGTSETEETPSDPANRLVLDYDPETNEELVTVNEKLVSNLKPHQREGVEFMWNKCFQSIEQSKKNKGSGCILGHCMGLGKTLQVNHKIRPKTIISSFKRFFPKFSIVSVHRPLR